MNGLNQFTISVYFLFLALVHWFSLQFLCMNEVIVLESLLDLIRMLAALHVCAGMNMRTQNTQCLKLCDNYTPDNNVFLYNLKQRMKCSNSCWPWIIYFSFV